MCFSSFHLGSVPLSAISPTVSPCSGEWQRSPSARPTSRETPSAAAGQHFSRVLSRHLCFSNLRLKFVLFHYLFQDDSFDPLAMDHPLYAEDRATVRQQLHQEAQDRHLPSGAGPASTASAPAPEAAPDIGPQLPPAAGAGVSRSPEEEQTQPKPGAAATPKGKPVSSFQPAFLPTSLLVRNRTPRASAAASSAPAGPPLPSKPPAPAPEDDAGSGVSGSLAAETTTTVVRRPAAARRQEKSEVSKSEAPPVQPPKGDSGGEQSAEVDQDFADFMAVVGGIS